MHARFSGWQSLALVVALLSSVIGGVVVARADADPGSGTRVQKVPEVSDVDELSSVPDVAVAEVDAVFAAFEDGTAGAGNTPGEQPWRCCAHATRR
jgi:hypothetical protein